MAVIVALVLICGNQTCRRTFPRPLLLLLPLFRLLFDFDLELFEPLLLLVPSDSHGKRPHVPVNEDDLPDIIDFPFLLVFR